jgi:hypothetical protein
MLGPTDAAEQRGPGGIGDIVIVKSVDQSSPLLR